MTSMRLGDLARPIHVAPSAAASYASFAGLTPEQVMRELPGLVAAARLVEEGEGTRPALYRYRSRRDGVDLSLRVVVEGEEAVVVSLTSRGYRPPKGGRKRTVDPLPLRRWGGPDRPRVIIAEADLGAWAARLK